MAPTVSTKLPKTAAEAPPEKVTDFIKRMEIPLKDHRFSGEGPIRVLDFLALFVREADIQSMSEAKAFIALPSFLTQFSKSHYEAVSQLLTADEGGIASLPEVVQYLLRNYAQSTHIAAGIMYLPEILQAASESDKFFSKRINDAVARCRNFQSTEDVATLFIDGLDATMRTLVARHREAYRRMTYL